MSCNGLTKRPLHDIQFSSFKFLVPVALSLAATAPVQTSTTTLLSNRPCTSLLSPFPYRHPLPAFLRSHGPFPLEQRAQSSSPVLLPHTWAEGLSPFVHSECRKGLIAGRG